MLVYDDVTVTGAFGVSRLTGFEADIRPNTHAKAVVRGIAKNVIGLARWQSSETEQEVTVSLGEGEILFCGLVENVVWEQEAETVYRVEIRLVSGSTALDRKKECRSFQDTDLSYAEIVRRAISFTRGAGCICTVGGKEKPMRPVIQYAETDWTFAKRLAGMASTAVYPEVCRHGAYMWFGIPGCGGAPVEPDMGEYTHGISSVFYELGGMASGYDRRSFEYYRVECRKNYETGAKVRYAGMVWRVLEKQIRLERGELLFTYLLGKSCLATAKKTYNPLFTGRSVHGVVIGREGDSVKLHLDMDKEQETSTAYAYKWVPDTGSAMYCMPESGTTVSLYFPDEDERNAIAVNCIRDNGAACSEMEDTSKRALTTADGKRLYLETEDMGLDIREAGHKISIGDKAGITMESGKKTDISAAAGIRISARTITMETVGSLNLLRNPDR